MRAVWSFWSLPFNTYYGGVWHKPLHHLLAWGLSLRNAAKYYPDTALVTDTPGRKLLIDQLGLPFSTVSTELDSLAHADPGWWALGKLVAYAQQDRPFLHLDSDVFLWKPLPLRLTSSPVFTQNLEGFHENDHYYHPQDIEWAFAQEALTLPIEWRWTRASRSFFPSDCCGILGGSNVAFLRHFAKTALELVLAPKHANVWARLADKRGYNIVVEQFFLSACAEFHQAHPQSPYSSVQIARLFPSWSDCYDLNHAARLGYTHLMSDAKSAPAVGERLEARMRREDPMYVRRCEQVLAVTRHA